MLQFSLGVGVVMCLRAVADRAGEANKKPIYLARVHGRPERTYLQNKRLHRPLSVQLSTMPS